ncbi:hypothetical protein ANCCAN_13704 [Ancylostoma caninum]|uniref:Uncharacterized protein n=1 Tax=Ancylostoma caninum TaxID=29170 RepID=A0A368GBH6_ANCCA|nr:hypothetical protein ANCCAN_13704 [Ancylostoma caninum]
MYSIIPASPIEALRVDGVTEGMVMVEDSAVLEDLVDLENLVKEDSVTEDSVKEEISVVSQDNPVLFSLLCPCSVNKLSTTLYTSYLDN